MSCHLLWCLGTNIVFEPHTIQIRSQHHTWARNPSETGEFTINTSPFTLIDGIDAFSLMTSISPIRLYDGLQSRSYLRPLRCPQKVQLNCQFERALLQPTLRLPHLRPTLEIAATLLRYQRNEDWLTGVERPRSCRGIWLGVSQGWSGRWCWVWIWSETDKIDEANECNKRRGTDVINSALESSKANNNAYGVSLFALVGWLAGTS